VWSILPEAAELKIPRYCASSDLADSFSLREYVPRVGQFVLDETLSGAGLSTPRASSMLTGRGRLDYSPMAGPERWRRLFEA